MGAAQAKSVPQPVSKRFGKPAHRYRAQPVPIIDIQAPKSGSAESVCLFQDRVEHWNEIAWRRVDDTQYLGGGGLLFQRFACLGDQPCILHRDDCVRGKVLQQRDFLLGERPYLLPINRDRSEQLVILAKRDSEKGAGTSVAHERLRPDALVIRFVFDEVGYRNNAFTPNKSFGHASRCCGHRLR